MTTAAENMKDLGEAYRSARQQLNVKLFIGTNIVLVLYAILAGDDPDKVCGAYAILSLLKSYRKAVLGLDITTWKNETLGRRLTQYDSRIQTPEDACHMAKTDTYLSHLVLGPLRMGVSFLLCGGTSPEGQKASDSYTRSHNELLSPSLRFRYAWRPERSYLRQPSSELKS